MYLSRKTERDYTFEEAQFTIRKGLKIFIPIYAIQNDPRVYPNPQVFDPERFHVNNNATDMKNSMYYLPFGTGPRNCIGNLELTLAYKPRLQYSRNYFETNRISILISNLDLEYQPSHSQCPRDIIYLSFFSRRCKVCHISGEDRLDKGAHELQDRHLRENTDSHRPPSDESNNVAAEKRHTCEIDQGGLIRE